MNFLCYQHATKEKPQKPYFSDYFNIYKTKTIPKTDTSLKSKSDCRNNIRKSELTFTFCSVLFYMSKITFRIIFVWERMYKNKKSKKFIFNLKHMEENTNYLFSAIKLDAKKSFKHPWEAH